MDEWSLEKNHPQHSRISLISLSYRTILMHTSFEEVAKFHVQFYFGIVTVECAHY